ncbi:hypothetical protein N7499_002057 [Penicillium canescens]|uniref:SsDNA binding protein n=1 Tax=Penicillium canescens TaxID=5083 RepID=A0AAD6N5V3_PENCN|nr:uncharacterized protein N7446_009596 [Penicillium canescens]KAJ6002077.1 hypothetical protein N7522_007304 [Penicillium canescens]KAJ6034840.1 hypothetical protein N7460_009015 [Penicillium canescens]KAJ6046504.1 hypothetical protein N7444_007758 [Penicillium canescens]KAJ6053584.1 hypothetical protein N7446_009596 [Penicillium canescens]KAJ6097683.1 hypothetical protein N7499_002057 [Penicillium canescens]
MSSFLNSLRPGLRMAKTATQTARAFSSSPAHALARLTVTGRLGADPELQATASGQEIIRYVVGSSHGPRDNRQTSWFRITSFAEGSQRDHLLSLTKGTLVLVEGDASLRTYDDAEGKSRTGLNVIQRYIEVLKRPFNADQESQQ